jgi:cohesin loading factor subunit SCC2
MEVAKRTLEIPFVTAPYDPPMGLPFLDANLSNELANDPQFSQDILNRIVAGRAHMPHIVFPPVVGQNGTTTTQSSAPHPLGNRRRVQLSALAAEVYHRGGISAAHSHAVQENSIIGIGDDDNNAATDDDDDVELQSVAASSPDRTKVIEESPPVNMELSVVVNRSEIKVQSDKDKARRRTVELFQLIDNVLQANCHISKDDPNFNKYWLPYNYSESSEPALAGPWLVAIDEIVKLLSAENIETGELDKIKSLYSILERSLNNQHPIANARELVAIGDVEEVLAVLAVADNAIKACKLALRLFLCRFEQPEMCPEMLVRLVTDAVSDLLRDKFLPLAQKELSQIPVLAQRRPMLTAILNDITKVIELICCFCSISQIPDYIKTKLQFLSLDIIFCESVGKDSDSLFGTANFESLRAAGSDLLACIYWRLQKNDRESTISAFLDRVEKLPTTKSKARRFRVQGGHNIQLATSVILRLLHISGASVYDDAVGVKALSLDEGGKAQTKYIREFTHDCTEAIIGVRSTCDFIVCHLLQKAQSMNKTAAKQGEDPHRELLDLFCQDFVTLLLSPQWPAAEILVSTLLVRLCEVATSDTTVNAINLALEHMGVVGPPFLALRQAQNEFIDLKDASQEKFEGLVKNMDVVLLELAKSAEVPFKYFFTLCGHLLDCNEVAHGTTTQQSDQLGDGIANQSERMADETAGPPSETSDRCDRQVFKLLTTNYRDEIGKTQGKSDYIYSYFRVLLFRDVSRCYDLILAAVLQNLGSNKPLVRRKALSILGDLIEKNPEVIAIERVNKSLGNLLIDVATAVRDAAIDVVGKVLKKSPLHANNLAKVLCERSGDRGVSVRRKVVKYAREFLEFVSDKDVRIYVVDNLLQRIADDDQQVAELSQKALREAFFERPAGIDKSSAYELYSSEIQASLDLVTSVWERRSNGLRITEFLSMDVPVQHIPVIKSMVSSLLEAALADETVVDRNMDIISAFTRRHGKLITPDQLERLVAVAETKKPNERCGSIFAIIDSTLACMDAIGPKLTGELQKLLLPRLTRVWRNEVEVAVRCFWKVNDISGTKTKVVKALVSCLMQLRSYLEHNEVADKDVTTITRLMDLTGYIVRICDIEAHLKMLNQLAGQADSVAAVALTVLLRYHKPEARKVRGALVKSIGMICISRPKLFNDRRLREVFSEVMDSGTEKEQLSLITVLEEFLDDCELQALGKVKEEVKKNESTKGEVDVDVLHGKSAQNSYDGVAAGVFQQYLPKILDICLSDKRETAEAGFSCLRKAIRHGLCNPIEVSDIILYFVTGFFSRCEY